MVFEQLLANEMLAALAVFLLSFLVAILGLLITKKIIERTKTKFDDAVYRGIRTPAFILFVSIGAYTSMMLLSFFEPYIQAIKSMATIWFVLLSAFIGAKLINSSMSSYLASVKDGTRKSKLDMTMAPFLEKSISIVIYLIAGLLLLRMFNIEITPLLASLGIASLAVALALQDTLANFFASIYIVTERPINVGNYVKLESGEEGYVESISWRNSTIRMLQGNRIVVPNSKLSKMTITNYYYPTKDMAVLVQCGVAYGSDLKKVEKVTVETARKILKTIPGGYKDFDPFIRYHTFGDSNIGFTVILRVNEYVDKYLITHEFIKELTEAYSKNKIEISFPARNVYMRK